MRNHLSFLSTCLLLAGLLAASCEKTEETPGEKKLSPDLYEKGHRTVLVYMLAENNLSSHVADDLREMMQGSRSMDGNDRLVVFVDRALPDEMPFIAQVRRGDTIVIKRYEEDFISSDPERMRDIVATVDQYFPADSYGLVLWGHASGCLVTSDSVASAPKALPARRAYGYDTGNNSNSLYTRKWMNVTQMGRLLSTLPQRHFIMADCCCFMSLESAYELRGTCRYLIGSPAEIPATGAPYHLLVPKLFSDSEDFYRDVVDTYYNYYLQSYPVTYPSLDGYSVPLSVVDMTQMEQLAEATRSVIRPISEVKEDSMVYYYREEMPTLYDAGDYVTRNVADSVLRAVWWQVLDKAVPYRRLSTRWMTVYYMLEYDYTREFVINDERTACVSMFLPFPKYNFTSKYQYIEGFRQLQWYYAAGCERFFDAD